MSDNQPPPGSEDKMPRSLGIDHFRSPRRQRLSSSGRSGYGHGRRGPRDLPRQCSELYVSDKSPENVGILKAELYIPSTYVNQEELALSDEVSPGKYTKGLMQNNMAFCGECEDIYSICLTVVRNLLDKHGIDRGTIGHLEVGTETTHDKSKSVKSVLMGLFESCGNLNIEGVDCKNACYGGTAALFNAVQWVQSMDWDGRYAIVVAADIAVYEKGPARPTGGAGAVALLIGPDAPIVLQPGQRFTYSAHSYDFYKPTMGSEYPTVDGPLSVLCYLHALEACYIGLGRKIEQQQKEIQLESTSPAALPFTVDYIPYFLFHSPYNKLVRKAYARLVWSDFRRRPDSESARRVADALSRFEALDEEESFTNKELERALIGLSEEGFGDQVEPGCLVSKEIGNMYCGSLYGSLLSLLHSKSESELNGHKIAMFSYGSGLCSTMFVLNVVDGKAAKEMVSVLDIDSKINKRIRCTPDAFEEALSIRETSYCVPDTAKAYTPSHLLETIAAGAYYVERIDDLGRRYYRQKNAGPEECSQSGVKEVLDLPVPVCGLS